MDFHWSARSGPFGRGGGYPSGGPFWGHFWPFWGLFCHFGSFLTILGSFWSFWGGSPPSGGARIGFRLLQNRWFLGFWGVIETPRGGRAHLSDYGRKSPKKWHFIRVLRTFRPKNWSTSDLIIVCTRFTFSILCCYGLLFYGTNLGMISLWGGNILLFLILLTKVRQKRPGKSRSLWGPRSIFWSFLTPFLRFSLSN